MIDTSELDNFAAKLQAMSSDAKPYFNLSLEEAGEKFLDLVQANIQAAENVDFGKLLASFKRGGSGNIFQKGDLEITIGSSIIYAKWVDQGHKQKPGRFVPGVFEGKHFRYRAGAKTGIVLKQNFVKGSKFFENSVEDFKDMMPDIFARSVEQFISRYFS